MANQKLFPIYLNKPSIGLVSKSGRCNVTFRLTYLTYFICTLLKILKGYIYALSKFAAFWMLEPFGEVDANFSIQLSLLTQFTKIKNEKVIAENQCEKHKKSILAAICKLLNFSCFCCHLIFFKINFLK